MYKELIRNKCIDISRLLLLRAKELQINDNECHILMLVYTLKDIGIQTVTPQMIQNYSMLSNQELNKVLASLLNKNLIYNRLGSISLNNLEQKLLQENNKTEEKIYALTIETNEIVLDICINQEDLMGEPLPGRRFRGIIWLQGLVHFEEKW